MQAASHTRRLLFCLRIAARKQLRRHSKPFDNGIPILI